MLPVLEELGRLYPKLRFAFMGDPRFEALWRHWDQDRVSFTPGVTYQATSHFWRH